jgi:hypothetical protein
MRSVADYVPGRARLGGVVVQGGVRSGLLNAVLAEDLPSVGP